MKAPDIAPPRQSVSLDGGEQPMLFVLRPKSLTNETSQQKQILFCNEESNMQYYVEQAGLFTAAFQLFEQFRGRQIRTLDFKEAGSVYFKKFGELLLVSDSEVLNGAVESYLRVFLPDVEAVLRTYRLRFTRAVFEYYLRPFVQFCVKDPAFAFHAASRCVNQDSQCLDLLTNFYFMLRDLPNGSACIFHGRNLVFDVDFDDSDKFELYMQMYIKMTPRALKGFSLDDCKHYEVEVQGIPCEALYADELIDVEAVKQCDLVPVISAGVAYCSNLFAAASGFSRDGDIVQPKFFLSSGRQLSVYQVKIDIYLFVGGCEDNEFISAIRHHRFLSQDYQLVKLHNDFRYIQNEQLALSQGEPPFTGGDAFRCVRIYEPFERLMVNGVEIEKAGPELVFK